MQLLFNVLFQRKRHSVQISDIKLAIFDIKMAKWKQGLIDRHIQDQSREGGGGEEGGQSSDKAVEVEVLHIVSPNQIYVRFVSEFEDWRKFHQMLQEAGQKAIFDKKNHLVSGMKVLCIVEGAWHRGTLVETGKLCLVRLVDLGAEVNIDIKNVKKLEDTRIIKKNLFAKLVSLPGIEPAGSGGWSDSSVDLLCNIAKKKVMLLEKDVGQVDLIVEDTTVSNPVDVESVVRTSITEILIEEGLALKKNTRNKYASVQKCCSYCGIDQQATLVKCICTRLFCNKHIVDHMVKAKHHQVTLNKDGPIECDSCGNRNVFELGFMPSSKVENVAVLLCRMDCSINMLGFTEVSNLDLYNSFILDNCHTPF